MTSYKRNQVEQAIGMVLERSQEPSTELRTRLKRLLETDRSHGRIKRSSDPTLSNYAFFSTDAPGSGVEIWFSKYEAFALLIGHHVMQNGWPQGFAVSLLRQARSEMEKEHALILAMNPAEIFDQNAIKRNAREGDFNFGTTAPVLLTMAPRSATSGSNSLELIDFAISRSLNEAMKWVWSPGRSAYGFTLFELTIAAHNLERALAKTEPRGRGRSP